jgi:carbamoyl-phosphate synthase large subunit
MQNPFNVLITSLANKVPLVREVRKAINKLAAGGRIFGADCNAACTGRHFVDDFWQMPTIDGLDPDEVVSYCQDNGIRAIIPTRDGELLFFAENRKRFNDVGICVMISSPEGVSTCLDKKKFFVALKAHNGLNPIETLDFPDPEIAGRWVVKERYGAGSTNMRIDVSVEEAKSSMDRLENPICQPYIPGQEYSIDLYVCQNGVPKGCVVRKRDVIIDGESQVTTTVDRPDIEKLCIEAAGSIGLTGHVLFQIIENGAGELHIVECNCRFGGASTLSVAAGLDSFYWFFRECIGDDLSDQPYVTGRIGLRQIRYAEDKIVLLN